MPEAKSRRRSGPQQDSHVTDRYQYSDFLAPRYWGSWLFIGMMHLLGRLPAGARIGLARVLTPVTLKVAASRRRVAERNLALCFPEKTDEQRQYLLRETFFANLLGLLETARAWVGPLAPLQHHVRWEGLEHLDAARDAGQGVLMVGGHFAILDLAGGLFGLIRDYDLVYRKHDDPLLNYFMTRSRERFCGNTLARKDMRGMIRSLKSGRIVWYAPDQDYGRKASTFVPFFNIPTATVTMTSKLAKVTNARVIPVFFYREASNRDYVARFGPPLPIPSGDEDADAAAFNAWLETCVRERPEQYLWLHKRFKTRPEAEPSFY